jgi:hypothetical protein
MLAALRCQPHVASIAPLLQSQRMPPGLRLRPRLASTLQIHYRRQRQTSLRVEPAPDCRPTDVTSLKDALGVGYMVHPFDDNTIAELSCGDLVAVKYAGKRLGGWWAGVLVSAHEGDEEEKVKWNGKIRTANYTCSFIKDNTWPAVYLAAENYTDVATAQEHCWLRYGTTPLSSAVPAGGVGNPRLRVERGTKRMTPPAGPTSKKKPSHKKKKP